MFSYIVCDVLVFAMLKTKYDNETGKGDHKHIGKDKIPYHFNNVDQLVADFFDDVRR